MATIERQLRIAGHAASGEAVAEVRAPWDGAVVARVPQAGWAVIDEALALAHRSREALWTTPAGVRHRWCAAVAAGIERRAAELATAICTEAGKPISAARAEVGRAQWTFAFAASAALEPSGEAVPVALEADQRGTIGIAQRVPLGVVAAISPFNFPLNLAAHKVAPALAVGAPVVLKPPPQAPSAALILGEIAGDAGVPAEALQVVPCTNALAERLALDPRVAVVSFTGSARVGWQLKKKIDRARAILELGGNAAVLICADADVERAAERCAYGGYIYAGQVCISVQRVLVQRQVYEHFLRSFRACVASYAVADPSAPETVVGPLIDRAATERITSWLDEGRQGGARIEGGAASENRMAPALVLGAPPSSKLVREEIFGPVVLIDPFDDFEEALNRVNSTDYGLQAGIFTSNLKLARRAFEALEVGGVIVNDAPTFRSDGMPYGGAKGSGLGREGVRYAMAELCEPRMLVLAPS